MTPSSLAATAEALAAEFPCFSVKVLEPEECAELGMGAYLGVAQGADYTGLGRPKFIHMTYTPPGGASKKVALVGKGLTFDSGGYNIKAGAGSMIEKMKFDSARRPRSPQCCRPPETLRLPLRRDLRCCCPLPPVLPESPTALPPTALPPALC